MGVSLTPDEFKAIRLRLGLTTRQMARALGISGLWGHGTVNRWERGARKIPASVAILAQMYGDGAVSLPEGVRN